MKQFLGAKLFWTFKYFFNSICTFKESKSQTEAKRSRGGTCKETHGKHEKNRVIPSYSSQFDGLDLILVSFIEFICTQTKSLI